MSCAFCGKGRDEVSTLIMGKGKDFNGSHVFICNECVDFCVEIIACGKTDPSSTIP